MLSLFKFLFLNSSSSHRAPSASRKLPWIRRTQVLDPFPRSLLLYWIFIYKKLGPGIFRMSSTRWVSSLKKEHIFQTCFSSLESWTCAMYFCDFKGDPSVGQDNCIQLLPWFARRWKIAAYMSFTWVGPDIKGAAWSGIEITKVETVLWPC